MIHPYRAGLLAINLILSSGAYLCVDSLYAQNIVALARAQFTANPVRLTDTDVSEFLVIRPSFNHGPDSNPLVVPEARRIAARLDAHVVRFLDGVPWRPFHHTLGISGSEVSFSHPDEMFYALALALPYLPASTAARTKTFLANELETHPPYAVEGFDHSAGRARESYAVPEKLRAGGRGKPAGAFGVYAFWTYCLQTANTHIAEAQWARIVARMKPLLDAEYAFDPAVMSSRKSDAEKLNRDLAGLLGLIRLSRLQGDVKVEQQAMPRLRQLAEARINLERVNPRLLEPSEAATKRLHNHRLSRFCGLVPEVGEALAKQSGGCGPGNLKAFREERNGWFLAFGDRLIGGENYTNPIHFPWALFAGAAFVEQLPADHLVTFIDVPWCQGDFFYIEKCVYALWASDGRVWTTL